jgi:uncharacterized protein YjiS (DUF1127 family)
MSTLHLQPSAGLAWRRRPASAPDQLRALARRLAATWHEWRRRARGRAELARLDDHALLDIGLSRSDVEFLINKPFWRE